VIGLAVEIASFIHAPLLMDIGGAIPCSETQSNAFQAMQPDSEELTPYERAAAPGKRNVEGRRRGSKP
jgi:hypothetical protein